MLVHVGSVQATKTMDTNMHSFESEEPLDQEMCDLVADFFSVYAHPVRIHIFCALRSGPKRVSELAEYAGVSLQNISQHLRILRDRGAVHARKDGQHTYYAITNKKFLMGVKMIRDALVEDMQKKAERHRATVKRGV